VRVYRLAIERRRAGKIRYLWEYALFLAFSFFTVTFLFLRKRYRLIHVHNMPDVLVFSALVPRVFGAKVILDLHDPTPEVYMAKYSLGTSHPIARLLRVLEKVSIRFANLVLTPNIAFRDLFISRGCPREKIHIVMNSPQEDVFRKPARGSAAEDRTKAGTFTIMYHGQIARQFGLDTTLEAISNLRTTLPNLRFEVYGVGDFVTAFLNLAKEKSLGQIVRYYGLVSLESIAEAIGHIDVGLIPNKRNPFTEINVPTRIFEYLCLNRPVIAPRTKGILDYFDEGTLYYFEPGNARSLQEAILDVYSDSGNKREILERGKAIYQQHCWEIERRRMIELVERLLDSTSLSDSRNSQEEQLACGRVKATGRL
jgi:glycosyltransferase involved in cell wall biosynthesis